MQTSDTRKLIEHTVRTTGDSRCELSQFNLLYKEMCEQQINQNKKYAAILERNKRRHGCKTADGGNYISVHDPVIDAYRVLF